jgi:quinoprotein glucose dehydrogenase
LGAGEKSRSLVEWPVYRGDKSAIQYSALEQVNITNVHRLKLAWEYHHGNPEGPSMYSNPLIIDGLLYFTTPRVNVVALDAATGKEAWVFEAARHDPQNRIFHGRNRGLVYWQDSVSARRRIFNFVRDRIYAVDAKTGALIPSFGQNGFIDLLQNLPSDPARSSIEVTTPGIIYKDLLIVGSRVPEDNDSTPGDIRAYNAETGAFAWIFHTVPQKGELGYDTWQWQPVKPTAAQIRGAVSLSTNNAACSSAPPAPERAISFTAAPAKARTSSPTASLPSTPKPASASGTSKPFTTTFGITTIRPPRSSHHHDQQQTSRRRHSTHQDGLHLCFRPRHRRTNFPHRRTPGPASRVPGEEAWFTQPFPTKPPPLVRLATFEADLSNVTPESRASALEQFRQHDTGFLYTPASLRGTITTPGHQGGVEWGGEHSIPPPASSTSMRTKLPPSTSSNHSPR